MNNLIILGSARRNGVGRAICDHLDGLLQGQTHVVRAYDLDISPCIDCRACFQKPGCVIQDDMQDLYARFAAADNILFISPVYFYSVPGPLKVLIDRLQCHWSAHGGEGRKAPTRNGVMVLTGGGPLFPGQFTAAEIVLTGAFHELGARPTGTVHLTDADHCVFETERYVHTELSRIVGLLNAPAFQRD